MLDPAAVRPLTVAFLDDDAIYRDYVALLLSQQRQIALVPVASSDKLMGLVESRPVDCILLDYNLGQETGLSVHAALDERYPDPPPTVMLTGDGRERTVIKAMRLGIRDYLPKRDLKVEELVSVVQRTVKRHAREQAQKAEHRRLLHLSGIDAVTGLLAREPLEARLAQLDALLPRARVAYGLIAIEMAELQHINERFGLTLGDKALRAFAQRLKVASRPGDICGRYAGSTFLYLVDAKASPALMTSIGEQLAAQTDFRVDFDAASLRLTSHVGAALFPADGDDAGSVLAAALRSLAEARAAGERVGLAQGGFGKGGLAEGGSSKGGFGKGASPAPVAEDAPAPAPRPVEDPATRSDDLRRSPRQRVFKRGRIQAPGSDSTIDCTLRNVSQNGAALRFDGFFALPEEFDLVLVGAGQRRRVRVRWQSGIDVGVEYLP